MDDEIDVHQIRKTEYKQAFSLHGELTEGSRDVDIWNWEYRGQEPDRFVYVVAKHKKRLVGTQGMVPIYLNIGGKRHFTGKSESSLVSPKMRGKGLFKRMYTEAMDLSAEKKMTCVWGFTTATQVWKDTLGFNVYFKELTRALIPLRSGVVRDEYRKAQQGKGGAEMALKSLLIPLGSVVVSGLSRAFKGKKPYAEGLKLSFQNEPKKFSDLSDLYKRLRKKHPRLIHIEHSKEYVHWRIYDNPSNKHRTIFAYNGKSLGGYAYLTFKGDVAEITDIVFSNEDHGRALMSRVWEEFKKEGSGLVICSQNNANPLGKQVLSILGLYGAILRPRDTFVLKNISHTNEKMIYDIRNWFLSDLWSEGL